MDTLDKSFLARLRATELSQVWFVRDYLQLIFEGGEHTWSWQCFVWPTAAAGNSRLRYGAAGYRDALCSFIDTDVESTTESTVAGLVVHFVTGSLTVKPIRDEVAGAEIAMMQTMPSNGPWEVWRPGEGAFEYLR